MAIGIIAMFMSHILENIGMNIGIMPITGIPLPFVSVGGSSLITNMMAIGLLLNIKSKSQRTLF
ncbi:MAG: Rod shape-determining protein RodA [bacterium ADurb.Bin363]|nr:MAG: Rod shape-determining protein RodA [bacterium ADurb.Bin363]